MMKLLALLLVPFLLATFNFVVDPLGVWGVRPLQKVYIGDGAGVKFSLLLKNHLFERTSLVFGNSRAGTIQTRDLEEFTGRPWFNFAVPSTEPRHTYTHLEFISKYSLVQIEEVIVMLDYMSHTFVRDDANLFPNYTFCLARRGSVANCLGDYLFSYNITDFSMLTMRKTEQKAEIRNWFEISGEMNYHYNVTHREKLAPEVYNKQFIREVPPPDFVQVGLQEAQLEAIRKIRDLSREHGFKVKFVFHPIMEKLYLMQDLETKLAIFEWYSKELKEELYDFSYPSTITKNLNNYYDISHYDTAVSRKMIKNLYSSDREWGKRVHSLNWQAHVDSVRKHYSDIQ